MLWHGNKLASDSSVPFYRRAWRNESKIYSAMNSIAIHLIVIKKVVLSSHSNVMKSHINKNNG